MLADQKSQADIWQMRQQALMPERRTFRAWRPISSVSFGAGVAKSDRNDGDFRSIFKSRLVQPQPSAQTIPACVVPGNPGFMNLPSGCLADDQQTGGA